MSEVTAALAYVGHSLNKGWIKTVFESICLMFIKCFYLVLVLMLLGIA